MPRRLIPLLLTCLVGLAGCDYLGIESATVALERRAAEGRAIGAACRHAGRAIEDCYLLNRRADKAAVFAGWREMNDYMTENRIEVVPPQGSEPESVANRGAADAGPGDDPAAGRRAGS
jgi:hypothetical protein